MGSEQEPITSILRLSNGVFTGAYHIGDRLLMLILVPFYPRLYNEKFAIFLQKERKITHSFLPCCAVGLSSLLCNHQRGADLLGDCSQQNGHT